MTNLKEALNAALKTEHILELRYDNDQQAICMVSFAKRVNNNFNSFKPNFENIPQLIKL